MNTASLRDIKKELQEKDNQELITICLHFSRFKKENKELLSYLLFEKENEAHYVLNVKEELNQLFLDIPNNSLYRATKQIRKVLRTTKKYIRYSKNKETEIELLIHFCSLLQKKMNAFKPSKTLLNIYNRQIDFIQNKIPKLHEDLQYDYNKLLEDLY